MTLEDLRELIQDDIITAMDGYGNGIVDTLWQIVVDRFKEYDVSSSDITT